MLNNINVLNLGGVPGKILTRTYDDAVICDINALSEDELAANVGNFLIHRMEFSAFHYDYPGMANLVEGAVYRIDKKPAFTHAVAVSVSAAMTSFYLLGMSLKEAYEYAESHGSTTPYGYLISLEDINAYYTTYDDVAGIYQLHAGGPLQICIGEDESGYYMTMDTINKLREIDPEIIEDFNLDTFSTGGYIAVSITAEDSLDSIVRRFRPNTDTIKFDASYTPYKFKDFIRALNKYPSASVPCIDMSYGETVDTDVSLMVSTDNINFISGALSAGEIKLEIGCFIDDLKYKLAFDNMRDFVEANPNIGIRIRHNDDNIPCFYTDFNSATHEFIGDPVSVFRFSEMISTIIFYYGENALGLPLYFNAEAFDGSAYAEPVITFELVKFLDDTGHDCDVLTSMSVNVTPVLRVGVTDDLPESTTNITSLRTGTDVIGFDILKKYGSASVMFKPNNQYVYFFVDQGHEGYGGVQLTHFRVFDKCGIEVTSIFKPVLVSGNIEWAVVFVSETPITFDEYTDYRFIFDTESENVDPGRAIDETVEYGSISMYKYIDTNTLDGNILASSTQRTNFEGSTSASTIINTFKKDIIVRDSVDKKSLYKYNTATEKFEFIGLRK